jgi:hypothetical protein
MAWSLDIEEYYRAGDILSLKCSWFQDAGGAHPSHGIFTLNFGGVNYGKLTLDQIFGNNDEVIKHIKRFCELDVKRQHLAIGEEIDIDFDLYIREENPWEVFQEINFNESGLTVNLSPYSILPYVYGSHEVFMPWDYFRGKLNETFEKSSFEALINHPH